MSVLWPGFSSSAFSGGCLLVPNGVAVPFWQLAQGRLIGAVGAEAECSACVAISTLADFPSPELATVHDGVVICLWCSLPVLLYDLLNQPVLELRL